MNLYHLGKDYGTIAITIEGNRFRFLDKAKLFDRLPITDDEITGTLVEGWHDANFNLVCGRMATNGCGSVRADGISFILDESQFRLDVFVAAKHLAGRSENRYMEPTHSGFSLVSNFAGSVAGTFERADLYVENDTIVAHGAMRGRAVTSMVAGRSPFVHEATFEADRKDRRYSAGLFWSPTTSFLGRRRIVGAGLQSQFDTLVDRETVSGTPLEIVLAERARVDVFDGDRLLSTGFYEIGLVEIDTRNFPQGAYSLRIVVTGAGGRVREEERFFNKNLSLPPSGGSAYYAFAGMMSRGSDQGREFSVPTLTAGFQKRMDDQFALSASVVATDATSIAEFAVDFAAENAALRHSAMLGLKGEAGLSTTINLRPSDRISFDFTARAAWTADGADVFAAEELERVGFGSGATFDLPSSNYSQVLASASARLGRGSLRLHGTHITSGRTRQTSALGAVIDYPVVTGASGSLAISASTLKSSGKLSSFAGLRFFKALGKGSMSGRVGSSIRRSSEGSEKEVGVIGDISLSHHASLGETHLTGTAGLTRDFYSSDARLGIEAREPRFSSRAELLQNLEGQGGRTQYAASLRTGIGISKDTKIFGNRESLASAISVTVDGGPDEELEIFIDGQFLGTAQVGKQLTVFLQPYRNYSISARPGGASQVQIEASRREVTLFPGGVVPVRFIAKPEYVLFGRLVDFKGDPQPSRLLRTARNFAQSDEHGYFQLSVISGEIVHLDNENGPSCALPTMPAGRGPLRKIGDLMCQAQQN